MRDLLLVLIGLVSAIALTMVAPPAHANEDYPDEVASRDGAVVLTPTSSWNLNYADTKCQLSRLFGDDDDQHILIFEQSAPQGWVGLILAGDKIKRFQNSSRLYIGLEGNEPMERRERYGSGDFADFGPAVVFASVAISEPRNPGVLGLELIETASINRVVLRKGSRVLSFETGNMAEPFQAMNQCTTDLLASWGLSPEAHKVFYRPRWKNEAEIVRRIGNRYPKSALRDGEQAFFRMRVIVEPDGSVSDCVLEETTAADQLNSPACSEMMKAEFEPARGGDGKPIRSYYATSVSYMING